MTDERALTPNRVLELAELQPINRPNVNFDRNARAVYYAFEMSDGTVRTPSHSDYDRRRHFHVPELPTRLLVLGNEVRENVPLPVLTPVPTSSTSINWWPYPPWGQSSMSTTLPSTASPSSSSVPAPVTSIEPLSSTTSSRATSATTLSAIPSLSPAVTTTTVSALPPEASVPPQSKLHAATNFNVTLLYLIPVFIAVGLALGVLSGLLGYRWYSRRLARKGSGDNGTRTCGSGSFIPGPPYIPMGGASQNAENMQEASLTTVGSPSKYRRHGVPHRTRSWLKTVTGAGSRHSSTRNSVPPSRESTTRATAPSQRTFSTSPTGSRSRGNAVSPTSFSDEEDVSHDPSRYKSIRRSILERLQRSSDRTTSGVSRDPSRRTTRTYLSMASAYSGTHPGDSRAPSAVSPSTPPLRSTDTEWVPGSGFRIVEETISNPPPLSTTANTSASGLPVQTSTWDSGDALRQAVDTRPGERWLAWTRSWATSPPFAGEDRFTVVPSRRTTQEKKDVESLLRSPPQVTSSPLQSTLTFSPPPVRPASNRTRHPQAQALTRSAPATHAIRDTSSNASSIALGDAHGTAAMRYAARHAALTRVEEILAHSYSSREIAPSSPNAFGAALASPEDVAWAAGIEQRLGAAASAERAGM